MATNPQPPAPASGYAPEHWQAMLDSLAANVAVLDAHGQIVAVNGHWREFSRREGGNGAYVGASYLTVCDAARDGTALEVGRGLREIIAGERLAGEWEYPCHPPGGERWFTLRASRLQGPGSMRVLVIHEDVTARHRAESESLMHAMLLDEIDAGVIMTDLERRILMWSSGAERLFGWQREEALGRITNELLLPGESVSPVGDELLQRGRWSGEVTITRRDGSRVPVYFRMRVVYGSDGRAHNLVGVGVDLSERKRAERELRAARDYLRSVTDSMDEAMYTLDTAGITQYMNPAAERLLGFTKAEAIGQLMHRMTHYKRPDGTPLPLEECPIMRARVGGEVVRVEDDVFIRRDGTPLPVRYTASPFYTEGGLEGCVVLFSDISERKREEERIAGDREKLAWARRVREALTEDRFELYAQPIVDCNTGVPVQRELLLRMHDPEGPGVVAPGLFLPVAEELGLVGEIDRWVITRAGEIAAGGEPVELNVSARTIGDARMVDFIEHAVERSGADPRALVFEITETAFIDDEATARAFVERLHQLGCGIALDDFGTGYGSFTYLKNLPIDTLKIDIDFVRDLVENDASQKVVAAVVNLARGFGMKTVGEGVEDERTLSLLRELGVDYAQGYHIGRPAPLEPPAAPGMR